MDILVIIKYYLLQLKKHSEILLQVKAKKKLKKLYLIKNKKL